MVYFIEWLDSPENHNGKVNALVAVNRMVSHWFVDRLPFAQFESVFTSIANEGITNIHNCIYNAITEIVLDLMPPG